MTALILRSETEKQHLFFLFCIGSDTVSISLFLSLSLVLFSLYFPATPFAAEYFEQRSLIEERGKPGLPKDGNP